MLVIDMLVDWQGVGRYRMILNLPKANIFNVELLGGHPVLGSSTVSVITYGEV